MNDTLFLLTNMDETEWIVIDELCNESYVNPLDKESNHVIETLDLMIIENENKKIDHCYQKWSCIDMFLNELKNIFNKIQIYLKYFLKSIKRIKNKC